MQTRTELILLQRTMVVVEGVARSLDEHINIWDVAHPVVEDYIKTSIGPKALGRDLFKAVRVLSRFGPRLPGLVEALLIRQSEETQKKPQRHGRKRIWLAGLVGLALGAMLTGMLH